MFIYAQDKTIDRDIFATINDACIVYDGSVVIDNFFRTNDPFILSAGSMTKYESRYLTEWSHKLYDSREVGEKLAELLLPIFDPTKETPSFKNTENLFGFNNAKKVEAYLPGDLLYLYVHRPFIPESDKQPKSFVNGQELTINNSRGHFSIYIDERGIIQSITYLGKKGIPIDNLITLYGKHEKYFNRLLARYQEGVITDFVDFFQEPWALSLFHDRFPTFLDNLAADFLNDSNQTPDIKEILDELSNNKNVNLEELYDKFDRGEGRQQWDQNVFKYLLETEVFKSYP